MFLNLSKNIEKIALFSTSSDRKLILQPLIEYIKEKIEQEENINLNFICTHNSRRSLLSQIWAQTLAHYFEIPNVYCYSGGTEASAFFHKVVETLKEQGFSIIQLSNESNPIYSVKYDKNKTGIICFSKTYDHLFNPKSNFAAIMTCSNADEGCPIVIGADKKIAIRYEDPKSFDDTELMDLKYEEKSIEIATELFYVFFEVKKHILNKQRKI
ncbi:protein-tyrosine-phosphatase [Flavobacterium columnare NBRC 100251 = ATCC 23463]|uniref:Protein-tyrosine-phosphatase n=2 Tax=Flavobacterium columnare TaxID=996 RepID=G8X4G0_FLACA|nr:protein-tyrosine-phosphatase [Flavobacterium columnare]AEW85385.1 protein-tyrosine-phosphatase [Flavobacterium columnare ATCC 49512]AMO19708.1 protein-tyrosine-phosphatase [Flavobacterium columnare]ANO48831.1 protein-tyrosine-phosphatase [Flavobacterium columnare]APT23142.1 protein-tyrosine-phosphatase [Flavobacterium columnare]AUX17641.1 protein tyrosine phosphatase [Flavobacterium columnare]